MPVFLKVNMAIKAIIFDFMQTLVSSAEAYKAAEKKSQKKLFDKLELRDWNYYKELYRKERKEHFLRSDFSRKNVWKKLSSLYNIEADNKFLDSLESEYWVIIQQNIRLFPETIDVLSTLKKKYILGMISNSQKTGSTRALDSNEYNTIMHFFDYIVISATKEIPAKPDPMPFEIMLEKLGLRAEEAIFVGDDLRIDIEGALNVGIKPIWIKHYSVKRNWQESSFNISEIDNLEQLYDIDKLI